MTAKEWLDTIKQAKDYNPQMTVLIEKYGEMLLDESFASIKKDVARQLNTDLYTDSDIDKAYSCGERQSTYHKKNGSVILPKTYEGVDG